MNYSGVSLQRDLKTYPVHSAKFENGMETGLKILFRLTSDTVMIELSMNMIAVA